VQLKLFTRIDSLSYMNTRNTHRATWRNRFLEISRRYEATEDRAPALALSGLRPRARMAGFATLRRPRQGATG
jgi:hypothetical protein